MDKPQQLRDAFTQRLKQALSLAGQRVRGEGVYLHEVTGVSKPGVSKWMNADGIPGRSNMAKIAKALGVRVEWLQYGVEPMRADHSVSEESAQYLEELTRLVPLLATKDQELVVYWVRGRAGVLPSSSTEEHDVPDE